MKKLIAILLVLSLALTLAACGGTQPEESPDSAGTRAITDSLGREVTVPETVDEIVVLGNTPRMAVYLGLTDRVVGYSGMDAGSGSDAGPGSGAAAGLPQRVAAVPYGTAGVSPERRSRVGRKLSVFFGHAAPGRGRLFRSRRSMGVFS